jgi:ABC-type sugar transport system substrate-binding protein
LKAGTIDLMLVQDSRRMGYEAVKALAIKLQGGTPPARLDLPVQVIAKADLGRPEIQALLAPKMAR